MRLQELSCSIDLSGKEGLGDGVVVLVGVLRARQGPVVLDHEQGQPGQHLNEHPGGRVAGQLRQKYVQIRVSELEDDLPFGSLGPARCPHARGGVRDVTRGGADVAIEAAGVPSAASAAVAATRTRCRTVIVGAAPYGSRLDPDWWQVAAGRTVQGSVIGSADPAKDIPRLVDMWRAGHLPLADIIRTYPFPAINQAIADMASGSVIKPVLLF